MSTEQSNESSQNLQEKISNLRKELRSRSYTDRHPELGRMIKCQVCGNRHYSSKVCTPQYSTHDKKGNAYTEILIEGEWTPIPLMAAQNTLKGVYGAHTFAKKRLAGPRDNKRARAEQRWAANDVSDAKRAQESVSRAINRGLANPGSRP